MKSRWPAVFTTLCLLCTMIAPAAAAEPAADGYEDVTVRIEAETIDFGKSYLPKGSVTLKALDGFSGGDADGNNAVAVSHGDVFYLGRINLIDLVEIRVGVAAGQTGNHYVFLSGGTATGPDADFTKTDTTWKQMADTSVPSSGWTTVADTSCVTTFDNKLGSTSLALKVWRNGDSSYGCGHLDYIDLIYRKPVRPQDSRLEQLEAESATLSGAAKAKANAAFYPFSKDTPTFVGDTKPDSVLNFGQRNLTGLVQVNIALASVYEDDYELYADEVLIGKATLGPTSTNTTVFTLVKTFSVALSNVPSGMHELKLKPIKGAGDHGSVSGAGNIDYIELVYSKNLTVNFLGKYNEVFATQTVSSAEALKALLNGGVKAPVIHGYQFKGWNVSDNECDILFETNEGSPVNINAVYTADDKSAYTLALGTGIAAVDAGGNAVSAETPLAFDSRITATAAGDVAYWVLDGAKVGFGSNSYTFYVSGHNNLEAVLKDAGSDPVVNDVVIQQAYAPDNGSIYTFTVIAQTSVPEDTITEHGIIYSNSLSTLNALRKGETVSADGYVTVTSSKTVPNRQYMTSLLNVQPNRYRYAIAYTVVNGTTIYSSNYARVHTGSGAPEIVVAE